MTVSGERPPTRDGSVWFHSARRRKLCYDVLYEDENEQRQVRISVGPGKLKVYLEYAIEDPAAMPTSTTLEDLLRTAGVGYGVQPESLEMVRILLEQGFQQIGPIEVASGTLARPGEDGRLDFIVPPSSEKARYRTDEQGNIDYRETHLVENVTRGSDVAIIHPPTPGTPGTDVFDREVPTSPGKPLSVRMGQNVELDEDSGRIRSLVDGRVVYEDKVLSVVQTYVVDGDVDLSVGNIDFVGDVEVRGQVLEDFSIRGRGSILIHGTVEASDLWSEGDIVIEGGVSGKGRSRVCSENGRVVGKYLNDVHVEAIGDVEVQKEIVNASVKTNGTLRIADGAIVSGEVWARCGLEAGTIGSALGVVTRVAVGLDWQAEQRRQDMGDALAEAETLLQRAGEVAGPVAERAERMVVFTAVERDLVVRLVKEMRRLQAARSRLLAEREAAASDTKAKAVLQVNVNKDLHAGTVLRLGEALGQIATVSRGPLAVVPTAKGDGIQVAPYKELPPGKGA